MHHDIHIFFTTVSDGVMTDESNRRRFLVEQGLSTRKDITMRQTHSDKILVVDDDYVNQTEADGLITSRKDVALFCKAADCPPILYFDPVKRVIAVTHCGWRGTFAGLAQKMINTFIEYADSLPEDIIVTIGPGIGVCCFNIKKESSGEDLVDITKKEFGKEFVRGNNIDLQMINKEQLLRCGVKSSNISVTRICTACGTGFFSYQGMGMEVGKIRNFAGVIAMR